MRYSYIFILGVILILSAILINTKYKDFIDTKLLWLKPIALILIIVCLIIFIFTFK